MGFTAGGSSKGGPLFNNTPQTVADLNAGRAYTEKVGNRRVGTTTERNAATGADVWVGLLWGDTTDGHEYKYNGSGWTDLGIEDTGWITPTLGNSWVSSAGQTIQYRRKNGIVYFRGRGQSGTANTMFTLPAGFRPGQGMPVLVKNGTSPHDAATMITINTTGTVVASTASTFPQMSNLTPFIAEA